MNFIIDNWYLFVAGIALIAAIVFILIRFFKLPTSEQIIKIKEWLVYATFEAEKAFGSKTGALKLRSVYDKFIDKFPWLSKLLSFEKFSELVDEALVTMREMLEKNKAVATIINNK